MKRIEKMLDYLKKLAINAAGVAVGYLEMIGFKYPVRKYREQVSDSLWRGSRLDTAAVGELKEAGFSLIVNLCAENDNDNKPATYWKIKALHIPIMDNQPPKTAQVVEFLKAVGDPMNQPAYVHCEAGKGRTGVMVACYRIVAQNWDVETAIKEADGFGMAMPNQEDFIRKFTEDWKAGIINIKKFM